MSKVIKVTPVTVIKPPIEEEKPQEIIEVTPSLITSPDLPPSIDVESDIVNPIILSPIDMIQQLIDSQLEVISYEHFLSIIREVLVRFDTDPKRYKKEDYLKLILAIIACFKHLYKGDLSNWAVTEWSEKLSDEKIPTEKLVKETIDAIDSRLTWISNNEENQKQIDFINVVGDLDYYNECKESYPNAQIFYQDEKKWTIYANGLEYDFNSFSEFLDVKDRILKLEEEVSNIIDTKFELESTGPEIQLFQNPGVVSIDYTGVSSSKDWADNKEAKAKKFSKVIGIHKIFKSYDSILNSVFDGDSNEDIYGVDENTIIYFIADAADTVTLGFSSIHLKTGWGYIWAKGKLYNADLINLSQLNDDLVKTVQPTDAIFPSGYLKDKNWRELPEACYTSVLNSSGTYIVQLKYKQAIYSGIIPYKEVDYFENRNPETGELINKIEVNTDEEIPLTSCGYSQDNERLYLKVSKGSRNIENNLSKPSLFIASSTGNGLIPSQFELKFKKLL